MKIFGKIMLLALVAAVIVPAAAFAEEDAGGPAGKGKEMRKWEGCPGPKMMECFKPPMGGFPLLQSEEFKAEKERHKAAMDEIMKPVNDLREQMAAEIKKLREEYFPKPAEGEMPLPPDPEKIKEFNQKFTELVKKFQDDNEKTLREAGGKLVDETTLHFENLVKIARDNKDKIVDAHWRRLLSPPRFFGHMRERLRHRMHEWQQCPPCPARPGKE